MELRPASCRRGWLFFFLLLAATVIAYLPVWHAGFIWDDNVYVTDNLLLHSPRGLWQIWSVPGATPQYYPLTFTSFWVDYHLWKLNPLGYHLTNVLLQALNAILLWTVLRRLDVPGAWLAAAVFAVHPVNVESVAWVTERKNLLAGFFYLSASLACLQFWLPNPATADSRTQSGPQTTAAGLGNWKFYWLALFLYLCALLAKTATIALPVAVLLVVWWKRGKVGWRELFPLAPFLAVGMAMGLLTVWVEKHFVQAVGREWMYSFLERCLIAGRAVWFYLGKLVWPHPLMFVYPQWEIHAAQPLAYLPVLALIAVLFILWLNRKGWARPMLVALAYFLALLFPVLGFFNVFFFRYSFVADHLQYLAGIGPLALAAAGITTALDLFKKRKPFLEPVFCGTLLLVLGLLTWRQCGMYTNMETLWRDTLARNPDCWMAYNNLGILLKNQGRIEEAMELYHKSIQINPNNSEALYNLGIALAAKDRFDEAIESFRQALRINPNYADALNNLGATLAAKGRFDEAIENYQKAIQINPNFYDALYNLGVALAARGRFDEAIENYRQAIRINPNNSEALYNLGNALAARGRFDEAIENYRQAIRINPNNSEALNNLGNALAARGRFDEAIENYRQAIRINPNNSDALDNLGIALAAKGRFDEAIGNYRQAIQVNSNRTETFFHLGMTLGQLGRTREAVAQYREALRLNPNLAGALNNLAWVLAANPDDELRHGAEAVRLAERACELTHYGEPLFIGTLAAAYAEAGRFPEAVTTAEKAEQLATTAGLTAVAAKNRQLLELYRAGKPYHEPAPTGP
ncbi:MAG: tetratricopeptide repeat protein [Verrucomicrobiota bacterium]